MEFNVLSLIKRFGVLQGTLWFFIFCFGYSFAGGMPFKLELIARGEEVGTDVPIQAWDVVGDEIVCISRQDLVYKINIPKKLLVPFLSVGQGPEEVKRPSFLDVDNGKVYVMGFRENQLKVYDAKGKFLHAIKEIPKRVDYFQVQGNLAVFIHSISPPHVVGGEDRQVRFTVVDLEKNGKVLSQNFVNLKQLKSLSEEVQMVTSMNLCILSVALVKGRVYVYPFAGLGFMETFLLTEPEKIERFPNYAMFTEYLAPEYDQFPKGLKWEIMDSTIAVQDFCIDEQGRHYIVSGTTSLEEKDDGDFPRGKRITVTEDFNPIATWDLDIEVSNILYLPSRNALILRERNDGDLYEIKL